MCLSAHAAKLIFVYSLFMLSINFCCLPNEAFAQCAPKEVQKLLASDGAEQDYYGWASDISGDLAIVGSWADDDNGVGSGSAYIYRWNSGSSEWIEEQKLLASDGEYRDFFGASVAICNNTAIVGAYKEDDNGEDAGAAYVFRWDSDSSEWVEEQKLLASDGAVDDNFGWNISLDNDVAVMGALLDENKNGMYSGAVYVFRWNSDSGQWIEEQKLIPSDGAPEGFFGIAVSIKGDAIVVGSRSDENGLDSGSAYIFRWDSNLTEWIEEQKVVASDSEIDDRFGQYVSMGSDVLIVGAYRNDDNGDRSGSAYIFRWDVNSSNWIEEQKLLPSDGTSRDIFGWSVSIGGSEGKEVAIVGSPGDDDNGDGAGSAYIYLWDGKSWIEDSKFTPSDGTEGDGFTTSCSIDGNRIIIGAEYDDDLGNSSGSAYIFDLNCGSGNIATLTDFSVITGTLLSGVLTDLETSDDSYIHTRSGFGSTVVDLHSMEMIVSAETTVDAPATLDLTIESRIDEPAGLAQIRMRNWNTNQFESVGSYSIGNTDQINTINSIDATNYVNIAGAGEIDLSIKHLVFVPFLAFTFESFIDQVEIVVN